MKKLLLFVLISSVFMSCNPWKFVAEYDHNVDFKNYHTFGLLNWNPLNDKIVKPETKKYLLLSIKEQLEERGYVYQENDADLQVSIFVLVQEETSYSAYANHYAGYAGYSSMAVGVGVGSGGAGVAAYGYGMPTYPYTAVSHDYNVGTLIVDLLDRDKKRQVWQGVASGRLADDGVTEKDVYRDINRLFATLPVKKVKK